MITLVLIVLVTLVLSYFSFVDLFKINISYVHEASIEDESSNKCSSVDYEICHNRK